MSTRCARTLDCKKDGGGGGGGGGGGDRGQKSIIDGYYNNYYDRLDTMSDTELGTSLICRLEQNSIIIRSYIP